MTDKEFQNLEVGKTFKSGNTTLIVEEVDSSSCAGCFFKGKTCIVAIAPDCSGRFRKDKKDVIFKEVE